MERMALDGRRNDDPLDQLPDSAAEQLVPLSLSAQLPDGLLSPTTAVPAVSYESLASDMSLSNLASISLDAPDPTPSDTSEPAPAAAAAAASGAGTSASLSGAGGSSHSLAAGDTPAAAVAPMPVAADALARPSQPDIPIKVWVRDPEKVERSLGVGSFVTYLVKTECSSGALGASPAADSSSSSSSSKHVFEVRRRFSDFDVLHRLLKRHYRGYCLPPLPDKAFLDSRFAGDNFLAVRKVDLQAYCCTVANHPALHDSPELRWFLTFSGDLANCSQWQAMQHRTAPMEALLALLRPHDSSGSSSGSSAEQPGSGGQGGEGGGRLGGSVNMMLRMKHSLMNAVLPKVKPELAPEEKALVQAKEWLKELQQHLTGCVGAVRSLVSNLEAVAEDWSALGRSFSFMARWEEGQAQSQGQYTAAGSSAVQRAADLQLLGYSAVRQHAVEKQFVLRTGASLVFLHDWWVLIPEVIGALQEREDFAAAVQMLHEELLSKQAAASKAAAALGPAAAGDKRHLALLASISALQDKLVAARQHYQLLRERNEAELLRLNLQRAIDFRSALTRFAQVQAHLAQAAGDVWAAAAEQLSQEQQPA